MIRAVRQTYFTADLFKFLRDLKKHNDREWFAANKSRYEELVRDPILRFITDFGEPLGKISRRFVADPRPVGGSLFRIHRDVRFAKDKSPYKTHVAAHFRHEAAQRDVHAPGFYFHLEPGRVFVAAGLWGPDGDALAAVRDVIVGKPERWKKAVAAAAKGKLEQHGEALKRPPAGYDAEHPLIEDLKRKHFVVGGEFDEKRALAADFMDRVAAAYRAAGAYVELVTKALGLPY
jgi:uncharacterized protein (TIGR02453 family)